MPTRGRELYRRRDLSRASLPFFESNAEAAVLICLEVKYYLDLLPYADFVILILSRWHQVAKGEYIDWGYIAWRSCGVNVAEEK